MIDDRTIRAFVDAIRRSEQWLANIAELKEERRFSRKIRIRRKDV